MQNPEFKSRPAQKIRKLCCRRPWDRSFGDGGGWEELGNRRGPSSVRLHRGLGFEALPTCASILQPAVTPQGTSVTVVDPGPACGGHG